MTDETPVLPPFHVCPGRCPYSGLADLVWLCPKCGATEHATDAEYDALAAARHRVSVLPAKPRPELIIEGDDSVAPRKLTEEEREECARKASAEVEQEFVVSDRGLTEGDIIYIAVRAALARCEEILGR